MSADQAAAVTGAGLVKSYQQAGNELRVLDGVDVAVGRGELLSVMGPSGSGKSTMLHLLGGLDTPDEGIVHLGDVALSSLSDDERTRMRAEHVGIIYQFFNLVPVLTASENVALPAVIAGQRPSGYQRRTAELLDLVGLADDADKLPSQLSGGQQQRVAIARALFNEPAVVLADEPTGNLDLDSGAEILELFVRACADLGQSVLMVTHDPRSAACGDRVVLLRDGQLTRTLHLGPDDRLAPGRVQQVLTLLGSAADGASVNPTRRRRAPLRASR